MNDVLVGIIGIVGLLALIAAGVHIGVSLAIVGMVGVIFIAGANQGLWLVTTGYYSRVDTYDLLTVPLFVFMGLLAAKGGMTKALYDGLTLWVGKLRAGLGIATVLGCAVFGTVCGSSLVVASVFAKVSGPEMRKHGYSKEMAYGVCASAGMIGMLIPPSIFIVIYGVLTEQGIGALLIAGLGIGILMTILYSIALLFMGAVMPSHFGTPPATKVTWPQRFRGLWLFWPFAVTAAIVIVGIFGGFFSTNEAASIASIAVVIIVLSTTGKERWKLFASGMLDTASVTGMIFLILGGSAMFSRFLTMSGFSNWSLGAILGLHLPTMGLIVALIIVFLFLGCFMDCVSAMVISVPLFYPAIVASGINPIWFAMIATLSLETGVITPPVGLNVYAAKAVAEADVKLEDVFRGIFPFLLVDLAGLIIILAFPIVATILPSLMFKG